ncbi:MAG: 4-hydroxythreonine-4-phosphate dehydrogenase PdxA [Alphaproteobacteria bacterium]|nr:4-hydroxythreonine-4-phosphate dehydrogenase PdxA [Alphaproteobacteria bacterium]
MKPTITLLLGDRNGIGPELCAKLLANETALALANINVLGDPDVLAEGCAVASVTLDSTSYTMTDCRPVDGLETTRSTATSGAGAEILGLLSHAANDVTNGRSDGVVFGPLNKEAMHMGGLKQDDEMRFLAQELSYDGLFGELNVLDKLWTTRVTSHVPISEVARHITTSAVLRSIRFAHETLSDAGFAPPRVAVAALNPHAGDGGNFGTEEIDAIAPAIAQAKAEGIMADGPFPSDTVFVRAQRGDFDVVVTMYHDQGQIAMKLMGFGKGVTVLGGLPIAVATTGHGTGYDIAGQGIATPTALFNAFSICCETAKSKRSTKS